MTHKSPELRGFHGIIRSAPKSACNTHQGLTRSTGLIREGLPDMVPANCTHEECPNPPVRRNGMCDSHYRKWVRSTPADKRRRPSVEDRFHASAIKTPDCWGWSGMVNPSGYALISIRSISRLAHRYIFERVNGPLSAAMQVDHICHNRSCVNPAHLRAVTNKQNGENRKGAQANNASSGIRGVSWNKRLEKWQAYLSHNGKRIHLGYFESCEVAAMTASAKRREMFTHTQEKVWALDVPGVDITIQEIA